MVSVSGRKEEGDRWRQAGGGHLPFPPPQHNSRSCPFHHLGDTHLSIDFLLLHPCPSCHAPASDTPALAPCLAPTTTGMQHGEKNGRQKALAQHGAPRARSDMTLKTARRRCAPPARAAARFASLPQRCAPPPNYPDRTLFVATMRCGCFIISVRPRLCEKGIAKTNYHIKAPRTAHFLKRTDGLGRLGQAARARKEQPDVCYGGVLVLATLYY